MRISHLTFSNSRNCSDDPNHETWRCPRIRKGKKAASVSDSPIAGSFPYIQIDEVRGVPPTKFAVDLKPVIANQNDICIVWDGANAGTVGFGVAGAVGSTVARMRIKKPDEWDARFLGRLLDGLFPKLNQEAQGRGATIPHVDKGKLEEIEFPRIARVEQRRITKILDKADAIRRKRELAFTLADDFLRSAFQNMCGDPTHNKKHFHLTTVEDICDIITDCLHTTPNHFDAPNQYPSIRSSELQAGYIDLSSAKYVSEPEYQVQFSVIALCQGTPFTAAREPNSGSSGLVPEGMTPCLGQRTMLLRANRSVATPEYLWSVLRSESIYQQAQNVVGGAASPHVNIKDIRKFKCLMPPLKLQQKFSLLCTGVFKLRHRLYQEGMEAEAMFSALSQRAFCGKL